MLPAQEIHNPLPVRLHELNFAILINRRMQEYPLNIGWLHIHFSLEFRKDFIKRAALRDKLESFFRTYPLHPAVEVRPNKYANPYELPPVNPKLPEASLQIYQLCLHLHINLLPR